MTSIASRLALLALFVNATILPAAEPQPVPTASAVTNGAVWQEGKPATLPQLQRPPVESVMLFEPTEHDWKYAHHPSLAAFAGRLCAVWSSADRDEDSAGQRVLYAVQDEHGQWGRPRILFQPDLEPNGRLRILTAAGFHQHQGTLVAYAGDYSNDRKSTRLLARTSTDGNVWSPVQDLGVPVCPNHGPQATASGRLIVAGNIAFPWTDDPTGLSGWRMAGIYPAATESFQDNPATFWQVAQREKWPAAVCEGSFYQTDDRVLHMLLRATGAGKRDTNPDRFCLWETTSSDNGATWSKPRLTRFSNTDAKFHCGRLPDGRFYCVSNPLGAGRIPLVLSTSQDGIHFVQHFLLGDRPYQKRFEGMHKGGHYGYPHTVLHEGSLYTIVSRQKESVEVLRVALSDLKR